MQCVRELRPCPEDPRVHLDFIDVLNTVFQDFLCRSRNTPPDEENAAGGRMLEHRIMNVFFIGRNIISREHENRVLKKIALSALTCDGEIPVGCVVEIQDLLFRKKIAARRRIEGAECHPGQNEQRRAERDPPSDGRSAYFSK